MTQGIDIKAQHRLGVLLICCATVCMASLDAVTKILAGLFDPPQILLIRWVIFLSAGLALTTRNQVSLKHAFVSQRPRLQIFRALVLTALSGVFVLAFKNLQLAEVIAIAASAPLIVTALSKPILGESHGWGRWASVLIGFVGVLIILRPGFGVFNPFHLLSLVGAVMWASYQILTRLAGRHDRAEVSMLYLGLVGVVCLTVIAPLVWRAPSLQEWGLLILTGVLAVIAHFLIIKALVLAPASAIQPFNFLTFVWAVGFGWLLFDDLPDGPTLLGAAIVIASGVYIFHSEYRRDKGGRELG